jgi:hypothetical protein
MPRRYTSQAAIDGGLETVGTLSFECSEPMLQEAPAGFNRTQVGRVRREEQQARLCTFDQGLELGRVMSTQGVEHDDIARVKAEAQSFADKFDKLWPASPICRGL